MLIGYGLKARKVFSAADIDALGRFVLNVAVPGLLFNAFLSRDFASVFHPAWFAALIPACLLNIGILYWAARITGSGPARQAVTALGGSMPNNGFIGYPILLLAMPGVADQVLALNLLYENLIILPLGLTLLELSRPERSRGALHAFGSSVLSVVKKPFFVALALGLIVSLSGIPIPAGIDRLAGLLAGAASAVALVTVGGMLHGQKFSGNVTLATLATFGKLILFPAIAIGALALVAMTPIGALPPELQAAAILSVAMPTFSTVGVFSAPYGHGGLASMILLLSTTCAFITLNILLAILV